MATESSVLDTKPAWLYDGVTMEIFIRMDAALLNIDGGVRGVLSGSAIAVRKRSCLDTSCNSVKKNPNLSSKDRPANREREADGLLHPPLLYERWRYFIPMLHTKIWISCIRTAKYCRTLHFFLHQKLKPATLNGGHIAVQPARSEEHTSELQSLMRISYAVFCLKKKN